MLAGNWKSYQDFVSRTDWMEPEDNSPSRSELFEEWIEKWKEEHGKADKESEEILWNFFDKIVYKNYVDDGCSYVDWTLEEIKDELLDWYIVNHDKLINQFGNLIRDIQRNKYESEVLTTSRVLYTNQTGTCI
jgi:hypothetical protein